MSRISESLATDASALQSTWQSWRDVVDRQTLLVWAGALVLIGLLVAGVWLLRRTRRVIVLPEAEAGLVRHPRYLDDAVLSDVLALLEPTDHGRTLRDALEYQETTDEGRAVALRTERTRALNKALDAGRARPDLVTLLDDNVDGLPDGGHVIEARGHLRVLAATDVAHLLLRARPMLVPEWTPLRTADQHASEEGSVLTRRSAAHLTAEVAPTVAVIETLRGRLLGVLDPEAMVDGVRDGDLVSMLAVTGRPISRRDPARVDDYLAEHLPADLREALDGRSLSDVASDLARARGDDLQNTVERGPGAVVRVAALW